MQTKRAAAGARRTACRHPPRTRRHVRPLTERAALHGLLYDRPQVVADLRLIQCDRAGLAAPVWELQHVLEPVRMAWRRRWLVKREAMQDGFDRFGLIARELGGINLAAQGDARQTTSPHHAHAHSFRPARSWGL